MFGENWIGKGLCPELEMRTRSWKLLAMMC